MSIFITGMAGFIGYHLQEKLKEDYKIYGIDALNTKASKIRKNLIDNCKRKSIQEDFLKCFEEKPTVLIHLAAETGISKSLNNPALYFYQNVEGTFNALEQCRKYKIPFFIYASSSSVYEPNQEIMKEESPHENALSFYGTSKRASEVIVENYCKQYGITAIALRFFTVYGPWTREDMAAYKFMNAIKNQEIITLYNDGNVSRDFTYVQDIVDAIALLVEKIQEEKKGVHRIFNIGSGRPLSVKKYAASIAKYMKKELIFQSKPLPKNELKTTYADTSALEEYINFKPNFPFEKGIENMVKWFNENGGYDK